MQQSNVKVIKAVKPIGQLYQESQKLRVAAYCRVSTDGEEQLNSFTSQVTYYQERIKENKDWEYAGIYSDEAVTGTKVATRDGFQKMIADCMEGKIDMVMTKSISRFARNTVDTLNFVRKLKNYNVAVYFEEENINTLTMDGELLLTILSSVAQQEVQNTSEHVKKGLKMKLQRGEIIGNPKCFGYDFDPVTKTMTINEEEADIVRYIFNKYIEGYGVQRIGKDLRRMGCKTRKGNERWEARTISGIITNEKYKGDILFGKTVTIDPIEKKRIKNQGQGDQYYFENHHEPIVSREIWEQANQLYKIRCEEAKKKPQCQGQLFVGKFAMSGKIKCACCNGIFTRRSHMNTSKTYKDVWKCKSSVKDGAMYCKDSKAMDEKALKEGFVQALNLLLVNDKSLLSSFIKTLNETGINMEYSNNISRIQGEIKTLEQRKSRALDAMIDGTITKNEYNVKIIELNDEISKLNIELVDTQELFKKKNTIKEKLEVFSNMIKLGTKFTEFDDDIFEALIHSMIIGVRGDNGEFYPHIVTYIFNLCGESNSREEKIVNIGSFELNYKYYVFDTDPETGVKNKILRNYVPCRIALKLE